MTTYSTRTTISGRESYRGMCSVTNASIDLAQKVASAIKVKGLVKEAAENKIIISVFDSTMTIQLDRAIAPHLVMPGDDVSLSIHVNGDKIDSSGIGEFQGGSLEMLVAPRRD